MLRIASFLTVCMCATALCASAQSVPRPQGFLTHAAFFSLESKQPNLIDPHAFVADAAAVAATGPQNIVHSAGVRPAYGVDDPNAPVLNAQGTMLGFTLGQWFAAHGRVTLAPAGTTTTVVFAIAGLVPGGVYSFFENHFAPEGVTFTALDGSGRTNTFTASATGTADGTIAIPGPLTHAEAILLIYHSDGSAHGTERGQIGVNAHHQLILRLP